MIVGATVAIVCVAVAAVAIVAATAIPAAINGEATKAAAHDAAAAQMHTADMQAQAQGHEADLLFKTEEADRKLDEKYAASDSVEEKKMMAMFDSFDEVQYEESSSVDRRGTKGADGGGPPSRDYEYPDPASEDMTVGEDDLSFS